MSTNENSRKLQEFLEEVECKGIFDRFSDYVHDDVVLPNDLPGSGQGLAGLTAGIRSYHASLRYQIRTQDALVDGDKVALRNHISGTQTGELWDFNGIGKDFLIEEIMIAQFRDGKVCRFWRVADRYALISQLGVRA